MKLKKYPLFDVVWLQIKLHILYAHASVIYFTIIGSNNNNL